MRHRITINNRIPLWCGFFLLVAIAVPLSFLRANAEGLVPYLVNGEEYVLDEEEVYVAGSMGDERAVLNDMFMLTADGVFPLEEEDVTTEQPLREDDYVGGGGLLYTDGTVEVRSEKVLAALRYFVSSARNSTLAAANLQNADGKGYEFGYYDSNREFHKMGETEEEKITMRTFYGTGIAAYVTGTETKLFELSYTSPDRMFAVHPVGSSEPVTWFAGYQYYGDFLYMVQTDGRISVINAVPIEQYVMGVCASEMSEDWPIEALKAQAVAARSYVGRLLENSVYYTNYGFDLTADTYSQAYSGCSAVGDRVREAVLATRDQYLTYNGLICDAQYFSSDGGATEDNRNVNGNDYHPYLIGVMDPYEKAVGAQNIYHHWRFTFTPAGLGAKVGLTDVEDIQVELSPTGNVIGLTMTSSSGKEAVVSRDACRTKLGLPSIRYEISRDSYGQFEFAGSGWGHNLGMSQFGAYAMAEYYEKTYEDILGFYYTGVGLSYGIQAF